MRAVRFLVSAALFFFANVVLSLPCSAAGDPPPIAREFRAAWIATVANIDWPSQPGLSPQEQRREMLELLDLVRGLRMNAVVLQVRPACDALYASKCEPWSEYLTGVAGQAPSDGYDPLAFAVDAAHERGLELHAWFNPYRALHPTAKSPVPPNHISKTKPAIVKKYGKYQWLDPGEPEAAAHSLRVILDVVTRYDVDAVHFDDYFYPYPITDEDDTEISFPDDESWAKYLERTPATKQMPRDDWRRENVNRFLASVADEVKKVKPWVRFGVSPFGIYRPGQPESIRGFDAYAKLYADSKKWLADGTVDYLTPQLYWPIDQKAQSFPVLLDWWQAQNTHQRPIWPGLYTSKVLANGEGWPASEIAAQIEVVRAKLESPGHVHFSIKAIKENRSGLQEMLRDQVYGDPAIPPATTWCKLPDADCDATVRIHTEGGETTVKLNVARGERPWLWAVQYRADDRWATQIVPGGEESLTLVGPTDMSLQVVVRAVDRLNRIGPPLRASANEER